MWRCVLVDYMAHGAGFDSRFELYFEQWCKKTKKYCCNFTPTMAAKMMIGTPKRTYTLYSLWAVRGTLLFQFRRACIVVVSHYFVLQKYNIIVGGIYIV